MVSSERYYIFELRVNGGIFFNFKKLKLKTISKNVLLNHLNLLSEEEELFHSSFNLIVCNITATGKMFFLFSEAPTCKKKGEKR